MYIYLYTHIHTLANGKSLNFFVYLPFFIYTFATTLEPARSDDLFP